MSINGLGGSYNNTSSNVSYTKVSGLGQSESTSTTKTANSAATTPSPGIFVYISDIAKAAQATTELSFKEVGMAARTKLDAAEQQVADKTGITASSVDVQMFKALNYSSFSDQELAAINLNSSGNFSPSEREGAEGLLAHRMKVSLEYNVGDTLRDTVMTIDALYKLMTPEVREVLGWTDGMVEAGHHMLALAADAEKQGRLNLAQALANLEKAQDEGGLYLRSAILAYQEKIQDQGGIYLQQLGGLSVPTQQQQVAPSQPGEIQAEQSPQAINVNSLTSSDFLKNITAPSLKSWGFFLWGVLAK